MKILIETIKKIENVLDSLENTLNEEYNNLLCSNFNPDILKLINKKKMLFETFYLLSKERKFLEKKYNFFIPYENSRALNTMWNQILKKCIVLKKLNLKNKILINRKFYLNQRFLELFSTHKKHITYNINGNLKT